MRDHINQITPAVEQTVKIQAEVKQEVKKTQEQLYNEIFMTGHNKRHPDGRVHTGIPCDMPDWYLAMSISPDYKEFDTQVEEGIYPAVKALVDKGYMTISSCQGHPGRIHLQIGFGNEYSRDHLIDVVKSFNIPTAEFIIHNHCANVNFDMKDLLNKDLKNVSVFGDGVDEEDLIALNAQSFNFQFHKNYKQWFFVDINVLDKHFTTWKGIQYWWYIRKKEKLLQMLIDAVSSDKLLPYKDVYREGARMERKIKQEKLNKFVLNGD
ncbi:hypothetical protein [Vibrio owensii]|uniref:hypothetical protein n=1 Tax=Vibrio harveyi group TaxID=717610 RepID=UPI003CC56498